MQVSRLVSKAVVQIGTAETTILESITDYNADALQLYVINNSTTALNSCKLYYKAHATAAYVAVISTWSTTASALNPITTTALQTLNNTFSHVAVNLNRCYAWKLTATVASGSTTVAAYGAETGYAVENALSA